MTGNKGETEIDKLEDMPAEHKAEAWTGDDISIRTGACNVLIVAPHGFPGDDDNTYEIGRELADRLNSYAIVNKTYRKPQEIKDKDGHKSWEKPDKASKRVNLNRFDQIKNHLQKEFLQPLGNFSKECTDKHGSMLVVWIHGIDDENVSKEVFAGNPAEVDIVVGIGQGPKEKDDRLTAKKEMAERLIEIFKKNPGKPIKATIAKRESKYCGWTKNNMNQFFREKYNLEKVQSIQLEIRKNGFRRTKKQVKATAKAVSDALSELVRPKQGADEPEKKAEIDASVSETGIDKALVKEAYEHLEKIFRKHFQNAMLDAGKYLIEKFYGNDFEKARDKKKVKKFSLDRLELKLSENSGKVPKKTWIYDAIRLAVDDHFFRLDKKFFRTYGKLGHSQKVLLAHVPESVRKRTLIKEAYKDGLTVAELRKRIKETKPPDLDKHYTPDKVPVDDVLAQLDAKRLEKLKDGLIRRKDALKLRLERSEKQLARYEKDLPRVEEILKDRPTKAPRLTDKGFNEWTDSACNINISKGCENGCVYCYARTNAYRRDQVAKGRWGDQLIRMKDVDKPRGWYYGLVGFPTTHDITTKNVDDYIYVLGKLLRAKNSVLIVSKPRIDCIKKICVACQFFRDKILFRFTIGAGDKKILNLWEPKAPSYEERVEALKFAKKQGFRTSVSMEPMLDVPNTIALVKGFLPLVTEDIWLGEMNHSKDIEKYSDNGIKKAIEIIKETQSVQNLIPIYEEFQNNPKVKWKSGTLEKIEEAI